jgi:hypothetical protein
LERLETFQGHTVSRIFKFNPALSWGLLVNVDSIFLQSPLLFSTVPNRKCSKVYQALAGSQGKKGCMVCILLSMVISGSPSSVGRRAGLVIACRCGAAAENMVDSESGDLCLPWLDIHTLWPISDLHVTFLGMWRRRALGINTTS